MTRPCGRPPKGKRCFCKAPDGRWERVTMLSAIRLDGSVESVVFEGAMDRAIFDEYIITTLAPTLGPGDILVLDNPGVHRSSAMQGAAEGRGAEVGFLPACSPDMNPTEKMWSKVKAALRKIEARTDEGLFDAVGVALATVAASDAKGWFESCGYIAS
jgi:transposase